MGMASYIVTETEENGTIKVFTIDINIFSLDQLSKAIDKLMTGEDMVEVGDLSTKIRFRIYDGEDTKRK